LRSSGIETAFEAPVLRESGRIRLTRQTARVLAAAGRFGVVWLPAYVFVAGPIGSAAGAVAAATLVAAVWLAALQLAFASGRLTRLALGPTVAAAVGTAGGLLAVSGLDLWIPGLHLGPALLLQVAGAVFVLSAAWETVVAQSLAARQRVLVVGAREPFERLARELDALPETPFELVGLVDAGRPIEELPAIVAAQRPDLIVLAAGDARARAFDRLLDVAGAGFRIVGLAQFHEIAFGRVPPDTVTADWFMSVLHLYQRPYSRLAQRAFDVVAASLALALAAPLLAVLALLIRRTPGPVLYRQTRLGEGGRPFTILKLRTMREDAEAAGAPVWAAERDPRTTGVGRLLRRTRLDELPQLWNVLRGEMSIVGPRPERPEFLDLLEETVPFWTRRHLVKPGITGWAQIRRGYTADSGGTADKLAYDLWYLRHRSLVVDLAICAKTLTTLISGAGAR
jgi:exopolysaccharide biosynthesis polyprenyl glycosylphosphotransferase